MKTGALSMTSTVAILPPVTRDERGIAFAKTLDASLNLDPWLACPLAIEHAPDEVLWELARQFDVAGPLYQAMRTRCKKQRLIRNALLLQRKRGTPWSVEEVMRLLGFADAKVLDRVTLLVYDGEAFHDGEYNFNATCHDWREYRIRLCLDKDSRAFTEFDRAQAACMAYDWTPLHAILKGWDIRHILETTVEDPAFEVARVYQVILVDSLGNRQAAERDWTQVYKDNSVNLRWRISEGHLTIQDVIAVELVDRSGEMLQRHAVSIVAIASNVTIEGIWHFIRLESG
jgi:hypothetical protein